jgi:hypothetical protein
MVPHHGIEGKWPKVFELRQEDRIFGGSKLQVAEEEERLRASPLSFMKGPGYNVRAVVPGVAADCEADRALRRLLGK